MDEILASIRRIISEDDSQVVHPSGAHDEDALLLTDRLPPEIPPPAAQPDHLEDHYRSSPAQSLGAEAIDHEPAAHLTDADYAGAYHPSEREPERAPERTPERAYESSEDLGPDYENSRYQSFTPAHDEPTPVPPPVEEPKHMSDEPWVGGAAASGVAASFGKLAAAAAPQSNLPAGNALEELVREMLRPLMKAWLDENLPAIVQARVDEEVERIARGEPR